MNHECGFGAEEIRNCETMIMVNVFMVKEFKAIQQNHWNTMAMKAEEIKRRGNLQRQGTKYKIDFF